MAKKQEEQPDRLKHAISIMDGAKISGMIVQQVSEIIDRLGRIVGYACPETDESRAKLQSLFSAESRVKELEKEMKSLRKKKRRSNGKAKKVR